MHPILFKFGPFTVYAYGFMLALAFVVASALSVSRARKEQMPQETVFNFNFICLIAGVAGARIFYVLENISYYLKEPLEIVMLQRGGLSWFGGLFLGFLSGVIYLKSKKISVYKTLDLISPFVALAQAIGRIGCLLNGCCFGKTFIPTQVYSSLILILIFFILRFLQERPHKPGEIFFSYLLLYSLKRFFIEFFRLDNPAVLWKLTLFQLISITIVCLAFVKLFLIYKTKRRHP